MKRLNRKSIPATLFVLFQLIAACTSPTGTQSPASTQPVDVPDATDAPVATEAPGGDQPAAGGTLIFSLPGNPTSLDPHQSVFFFGRLIMRNIYNSLLEKDRETGEFSPGLAESWQVSDDGLTITLNLRSGVTFHDNTPFDANSMVFAFDRILDPETASPYASSILSRVASYQALDDSTFEIVLKEPFAPFLDALSDQALAPVSPAAVEQWGADYAIHPVGTGPFMLKEWVPGETITLERFPSYNWAPDIYGRNGPAALDHVTFRFITESATSLGLLETGEVNVLYDPPPAEVARLDADERFNVAQIEQGGMVRVVVFQTTRPPFDDVAVRRAVAHAFDRDAYTTVIFGDIGRPAYGPLSPATFGYSSEVENLVPPYDPQMARDLLAEAGWTDNDGDGILDKGGQPFSVTYMTVAGLRGETTAELIQAQLAEVGIEVEINVLDEGTFVPTQQNGEFDITGMLFPASDPDILYTIAHSSQAGPPGWNASFYSNPELDEWLERGRTTVDPAERAAAYAEAQRIMVEELPYVPMYVQTSPWVLTSNVQGFAFDADALPILYTVTMDANP